MCVVRCWALDWDCAYELCTKEAIRSSCLMLFLLLCRSVSRRQPHKKSAALAVCPGHTDNFWGDLVQASRRDAAGKGQSSAYRPSGPSEWCSLLYIELRRRVFSLPCRQQALGTNFWLSSNEQARFLTRFIHLRSEYLRFRFLLKTAGKLRTLLWLSIVVPLRRLACFGLS